MLKVLGSNFFTVIVKKEGEKKKKLTYKSIKCLAEPNQLNKHKNDNHFITIPNNQIKILSTKFSSN